MPLTGVVNFGATISPPLPGGEFPLIAVDGTHHALARILSNDVRIGCAETETVHTTISEAQFRTDLASLGMGTSGTYELVQRVGAPGTSKFILIGSKIIGGGPHDAVGVTYRINAPGDVEVVGGFFFKTDNDGLPQENNFGGGVGQVVDGDTLYSVHELGTVLPFTNAMYLVGFPLTGTVVDTSSGDTFADLRSDLPSPMDDISWWVDGSSRNYFNRAAVYADPESAGIGIYAYRGDAEGVNPATCHHTIVNPASNTNTGFDDVSADFGLPFPDANKLFDDSASSNSRDDYTLSVGVLADGTVEIHFTRGFSDNKQFARVRTFFNDEGAITVGAVTTFQLTDESVVTEVDAIFTYREGDELLAMMRDDSRFLFGFVEVPLGSLCSTSGDDIVYPPCVTAWTQCIKILRRDAIAFRFTTLDQDFPFRGETYLTCGSLDPSAIQTTAQLGEAGSAELGGLITATGIEEEELYGGLFDDAFVELWLVPFDTAMASSGEGGEEPRRLAAGWSGKITHSTRGYKMEVLGPGARLEQKPIVQVYSPQCRWVFGDERCTVDLDPLAVAGTVTTAFNRGSFQATLDDPLLGTGSGEPASSGEATTQFANGKIVWLTGVNAGQTTEVKEVDFDAGRITLWALTVRVPEAGDTFTLFPGCAQDFATCKDVYDNAISFGGFPYVPGRDAIMESPNAKAPAG